MFKNKNSAPFFWIRILVIFCDFRANRLHKKNRQNTNYLYGLDAQHIQKLSKLETKSFKGIPGLKGTKILPNLYSGKLLWPFFNFKTIFHNISPKKAPLNFFA